MHRLPILRVEMPIRCAQVFRKVGHRAQVRYVSQPLSGGRSPSLRSRLAGAPTPDYTVPTTQYVTNRVIPANTEAADRHALKPEHAHLPLVFMLTLTQASIGAYLASLLSQTSSSQIGLALFGALTMTLGLAASTSHLGRPLGAWRAFLGLRKSWLSREIVVFGGCFPLAIAYSAALFFEQIPSAVTLAAGILAVGSGLLGIFCSVMIYHDTQRAFWRFPVSAGKFFGATLTLGLSAYLAMSAITQVEFNRGLWACAILAVGIKLALEARQLLAVKTEGYRPAKQSARLMLQPLLSITRVRYSVSLIGIVLLGLSCFGSTFAIPGFVCILAGELLERTLFFKAVVALKMPGGVQV